jgi:DHA1 family multidrug resistance protein-like MFS transporter
VKTETWRKNLYVLWGTQFLAMAGMNLIVPFLPFYIRQLGVTDNDALAQWSGLVFAGPFVTSFIATPFWGKLGDKHGRKLMVVRAIIGLGIAQVFVGFSQNVYQLLFFRLVQGTISGFIASAIALVSTSTPKERIGYALGFLQSATAGGTMLGPFIGGLLADMIGYRTIFFVVAGLCFVGGFVVIRFVQETPQSKPQGATSSVLENVKLMFSDTQLRITAFTIVLVQASALMIEPIFALYIERFSTATKYISTLTGGIFSIAGVFMVIAAPWWGKRNDRMGFKHNLILATTGTGVAYSLHLIVPNIYLLALLRAGLGFVRGGILHSLYSVISLRSPSDKKSGLIGIASSLNVFGNMVGPLVGGTIAAHFGIMSVFIVNSVLFLWTSLLVWKYVSEVSNVKSVGTAEAVEIAD